MTWRDGWPRLGFALPLVVLAAKEARGARDAESMLTRARRAHPHSPRLPYVARVVAEHLAQRAVALSP